MDYTYIKKHLDDMPENEADFINKLEKGCMAFNVSIKDNNGKFKSVGELITDITIAGLKYYREVEEINYKKYK
jgi:hypothetical protein